VAYRGASVHIQVGYCPVFQAWPLLAALWSLRNRVRKSTGAHPVPRTADTWNSFPGDMAASNPFLVPRLRMRGDIPPLPQYILIQHKIRLNGLLHR
jgi:hypothetical protein